MRIHHLLPILQTIAGFKFSKATAAALITLMSGASLAQGQMHIIINEVGSNVVASYTGSLNVDDATDYPVWTFLSDRGIAPDAALIANGLGSVDAYALTNGVFNFGPGSSRTANSNTGDLFGVENSAGNQRLMLPDGYVSGTILTGRLTFNSQTLAGLGLTEGTYTFTIGNGTAAETITLIIEATPGIKFTLSGDRTSSIVTFSWSGGSGFYKSSSSSVALFSSTPDLQNFTPSHSYLTYIPDQNAGDLFSNDSLNALNANTGNPNGTVFGLSTPFNVIAQGKAHSLAALYFDPETSSGSDKFALVFDSNPFSDPIYNTNVVFPSTSGSTTFELQGSDTFSIFNEGTYTLDEWFPNITLEIVDTSVDPSLVVNGFPSSITLGDAINATFTASDFSGTVTASLTGNVPPGLMISGNRITGVPTAAGTYTFTLEATDGTDTETQALTLTVNEGAIVETLTIHRYANTIAIKSYLLDPNGILSGTVTHQLTAGSLPSGFRIEGNELRGQFANTGTYTFTITSNAGIDQVIHNFVYTVMPPVDTPFVTQVSLNGKPTQTTLITEPAHAVAAVLEPYSVTIPAGEHVEVAFGFDFIKDPYSWAITTGTLPDGLVLDGNAGILFGTPTETGTFTFTVSIKDWRGRGYLPIHLTVE